jgi:tRNA-splicing ligase RtcB
MAAMTPNYLTLETENGVPVKMWTRGVPVEDVARQQLQNLAALPIIYKWIAAMPDVHYGIGATVGSVIPTQHAIIPAAVGVDIGCGMLAVETTIEAKRLPDNLSKIRAAIEEAVPHGRSERGRDRGAWDEPPESVDEAWQELAQVSEARAVEPPRPSRHTRYGESLHRGMHRRTTTGLGDASQRLARGG